MTSRDFGVCMGPVGYEQIAGMLVRRSDGTVPVVLLNVWGCGKHTETRAWRQGRAPRSALRCSPLAHSRALPRTSQPSAM